MFYLIGAFLGSVICFTIGTIFTAGDCGISRALFSVIIGIPLGGLLGILAVHMTKNLNIKSNFSFCFVALLYFTGGLVGSIGGLAAGNLLVYIMNINLALGGGLILLGIFLGGVLGIQLADRLGHRFCSKSYIS